MNLPKWSGSRSPARAVLRASASDTSGAAAAAGGVAGAGVVLTEVLVTKELLAVPVVTVVVAAPCLVLVCPPNQEPAPLGAECCLARSGCPAPAISPRSWPAPLEMVGAMVRVWAGDSLPQLSTTLFSPAMVRVHCAVSNTDD